MKIELLQSLKEALDPYLFFWNEWTKNGNCNLIPSEIDLINQYLNADFKIPIGQDSINAKERCEIKALIHKLNLGYQIFKDFVIVNFLYQIIVIAKDYGYDAFLTLSIQDLNLDDDLKKCLRKFKTHNLQLAFLIYKPEDFNRKGLFTIIQEFHSIYKQKAKYSIISAQNL